MLQDYQRVAQHSLSAHRQLYLVKEQRLALALDHYTHLNHAYKATSRTSRESVSHTQLPVQVLDSGHTDRHGRLFTCGLLCCSVLSSSSSSTKYDPDILKADISTTKVRVGNCYTLKHTPLYAHISTHATYYTSHQHHSTSLSLSLSVSMSLCLSLSFSLSLSLSGKQAEERTDSDEAGAAV